VRPTSLLSTLGLVSLCAFRPASSGSRPGLGPGLHPEFASTGTLVLGLGELVEHHPKTLVDILRALDDRLPIVGVVSNDAQNGEVETLLVKSGAPRSNLVTVEVPALGMWIRDYGPSFVRLPDGRFMALDAIYGRQSHEPDEWVPRYLAGYFRLPVADVPLRIAGGNLLANGEGWVFTSSQVVDFNERDGMTQSEIGYVLARYYGATDWMVLKPLSGEPTGHIDMFVTFPAADVAVVARIDPRVDPENAGLLDESAARIGSVRTRSGPFRVVRVPMPGHEDGKWRSYTNVIYASGTLLLPSYPDVSPEMDREALQVYSGLLPDWRIVPIDSSSIIENHGSLHCISVNVPELGR
jgi:agmatine/peptidylarginine deiminase